MIVLELCVAQGQWSHTFVLENQIGVLGSRRSKKKYQIVCSHFPKNECYTLVLTDSKKSLVADSMNKNKWRLLRARSSLHSGKL